MGYCSGVSRIIPNNITAFERLRNFRLMYPLQILNGDITANDVICAGAYFGATVCPLPPLLPPAVAPQPQPLVAVQGGPVAAYLLHSKSSTQL
mmetsp:Transcript_2294/g.4396  ORF Transcript_2294/g.4396 Transcript_2294/m.4396 type:complete len:93 (-) Transcript_2294:647-925(-)